MMGNLVLQLFSYSLPIGILCVMWKLNARRWTRLARAYRTRDESNCFAKRTMQTVILVAGDIGWNSYKGIATVSVTQEGIRLQLTPPFSLFHPPLLFPYQDCHVEPKRWYLIGKTCQYTLRGVSDVRMIVHNDLQDWIELQVASISQTLEVGSTVVDTCAEWHTAH
ncbi:hypothetical protein Pla22_36490 [Rubripirellula amarantea]|uniref:Uncharacterized protein n=1 Tax=Rubripirellula amarantea TaxID=2527999 RepID=A0A5C5WJF0_9BACT|nr:hypothetical protein [Rubripirellula amarantea]TWT50906.1 hypothetical protein Pla22_36490 [Rubripirellula amarantea]